MDNQNSQSILSTKCATKEAIDNTNPNIVNEIENPAFIVICFDLKK